MCSWLRRLSLAPLLLLALVACAAQADEGVTVGQATLGNVFLAGEPVRIPVRSAGDSIAWKVTDYFGAEVAKGRAALKDGNGVIQPALDRKGYFELHLARAGRAMDDEPETTFAILAPSPVDDPTDSRFGVMTHFAQGWDIDIIPLIAKAGIRHIRDEQYWKWIEKSPGSYAFPEKLTRYMRALDAHGIEPLLIMDFANKLYDDGLTPYSDTAREAYTRYAETVIARYRSQLNAVEIWNEYNGSFCKGPCEKDRPHYYAEMLKQAYKAIKSTYPDLTVLGGATVKVPLPYLERLFKEGALDYMDAIAVHPYRGIPEGVERDLAALKALMARYNGGTAKPIWVTEYSRQEKGENGRRNVARYLVRMSTLMLSEGVERMYWYLMRDYSHFTTMGLLYNVDSPQGRYVPAQSYAAYSNLIRQLHRAEFLRREKMDPRTRIYAFRKGDTEVRVAWSMDPPARVFFETTHPLTVVDIMGNETVLQPQDGAVSLRLDKDPIYVKSRKGQVAAVREEGRDRIVADSVLGFAGEQGAGNWYYGYYDGDGEGKGDGAEPSGPYTDDDFKMLKWTSDDWEYYWGGFHRSLKLTEAGAHPSRSGEHPVWAVRRWVSDMSGQVRIAGEIGAKGKGDGIEAHILVDGKEVFSTALGGKKLPRSQEFEIVVPVNRGSRVDFAVTPGPGRDSNFDATVFTARVTTPVKTNRPAERAAN